MTRTAALSVLLALVSNLAASRRGNEHVVTLDFAVVVCLSAEESLQNAWKFEMIDGIHATYDFGLHAAYPVLLSVAFCVLAAIIVGGVTVTSIFLSRFSRTGSLRSILSQHS